MDAADKANSELLLNFAHSAGTEQVHVSSALPTAAAEAAAALADAEGVAAAQRRAAADMLVRSLLDTIAQQSPGSELPGEAAVMQSLLQLANKCMDRQSAPSESELRAALERCLQRARSSASATSATALATVCPPQAASLMPHPSRCVLRHRLGRMTTAHPCGPCCKGGRSALSYVHAAGGCWTRSWVNTR